jgi:hypothetical protein
LHGYVAGGGARDVLAALAAGPAPQNHIKVLKNREILAGTFPNLPDKAIRTLKVVASDNNFYNGERSEPSSIILSISAAEKMLRGMKAHDSRCYSGALPAWAAVHSTVQVSQGGADGGPGVRGWGDFL